MVTCWGDRRSSHGQDMAHLPSEFCSEWPSLVQATLPLLQPVHSLAGRWGREGRWGLEPMKVKGGSWVWTERGEEGAPAVRGGCVGSNGVRKAESLEKQRWLFDIAITENEKRLINIFCSVSPSLLPCLQTDCLLFYLKWWNTWKEIGAS